MTREFVLLLALLLACQPKDDDAEGTPPVLGLETTVVNFGEASVQTQEVTATFMLENWGAEDLYIQDVSLTGDSSPAFSADDIEPVPIPTGESVGLSISFAPDTGGEHSGVLLLTTNEPSSAATEITLMGYGLCDLEPEVRFLSPVDGDTISAGPNTLEATVSDQCDAPAALALAWYAYTDEGGSIFLGASTVNEDGGTSILTKNIPTGQQVILTAEVTNAAGLTGQDSIEIDVE